MNSCIYTGACVLYCGHDATFRADLFEIEGAIVIRAAGPIDESRLQRPAARPTHHVTDSPRSGFWRPDLGILVVPRGQCIPCQSS